MSTLLLLAVIVVSVNAVIASLVAVARDGYRPVRTDRSRVPAPDERAPRDSRTTADREADQEAAVRALEVGTSSDVAARIAAATARPFSSAVAAPAGASQPEPTPQADAVPEQAGAVPSLADAMPAQTELAHTAVRRGSRARTPRRAASAPKSPR